MVLAGVAAAEFGVGGHGQVTLGAGGGVPVGPVGHDGGKHGLAVLVGLVQGLVAGGEIPLLGSAVVLAAMCGGGGLGAGAQAAQAGLPGGGADLAELVADVLRCPGGFGGVGVAQVQQQPVGHAADVGPVDRAESGEGLVPGGPQVGGGRGRFGADGLGGVLVAGQFPPGADGGGPLLPVQPVQRMIGDRAEGGDRPGQGVLGGVLADPVLAGVHQGGDLGDVGAAFGVGDGGDLRGPRPGRERDRGAEPGADPGVQDGGQVAGSGQVPFADRVGEDLGGVQAGQFGGAQGPEQPSGLVARRVAVLRGQGGHEQVAVALLAGRGGFGGPDRVQHGQVVGVGEGLLAGLGGRVLLAVAVQDGGQHPQRLAGRSGRGAGG